MSNELSPLEAFKKVKDHFVIKGWDNEKHSGFIAGYLCEKELNVIETALKALEIIKTKGIDVDAIKYHKDLAHYNFSLGGRFEKLTQEEFDLLKEILR